MRLVFAGTPEFAATALKAVAREHDVVAAFTQPDRRIGRGKKLSPSPVKQLAQSLDIPVFQPERIKTATDTIASLAPDIMVVVAYGMLIPQAILDLPKFGCLNIHASLLPRWRGAAPIQRAIEAGDTETGVSIMQMEASLDTGPVYKTLSTPIKSDDTSESLHQRLAVLGAQGVMSVLHDFTKPVAPTPTQQDHAAATYAHKLDKTEATIDWSASAAVIEQRVRAFIPWPICQTFYNGHRLRVWQATQISQPATNGASSGHARPGEILAVDNQGVTVQCGDNQLRVECLQKDGGKALLFKEFKNGFAIDQGQTFADQ